MSITELGNIKRKVNSRPKAKMIDIDEITRNELNHYKMNDIDELKASISYYGLLKPLEVYQTEDGDFMLLGGHRRHLALVDLVNEGTIEPEVSCLIYSKPTDEITEKLQIHMSNAQRLETNEEKQLVVNDLLECLEKDPTIKEAGVLTRKWIGGFIGCSERTAQKFINISKGIEDEPLNNEEKPEKEKKEKIKGTKDIVKILEKTNQSISDIFIGLPEEAKQCLIGKDDQQKSIQDTINRYTWLTHTVIERLKEYEEGKVD